MFLAIKPEKLPGDKISENYELEYGKDSLEMHIDSIEKGNNVLVIDDVLATGGTAYCVNNLINNLGGKVSAMAFLIILTGLGGKEKLDVPEIYSILEF